VFLTTNLRLQGLRLDPSHAGESGLAEREADYVAVERDSALVHWLADLAHAARVELGGGRVEDELLSPDHDPEVADDDAGLDPVSGPAFGRLIVAQLANADGGDVESAQLGGPVICDLAVTMATVPTLVLDRR
jgi:hypothetical protein